jgi:hypothetical protein
VLPSTRWQKQLRLCRLTSCAFGELIGIVFGEADPPFGSKVERVVLNALAKQPRQWR